MNIINCETVNSETQENGTNPNRPPIICFICDDFYNDPCILSCYHSFCCRCIENRIVNDQILCPICGLHTECKNTKPPSDPLMNKLIELVNIENPPCSNCDKRNRSSMYFCSTCRQALCSQCRENIHKAKMFSTHEILPMSEFSQDGLKKCNLHGEPYIMYSNSQHIMLCINCFRDISADYRHQCMDIDTAYAQNAMKLESCILTACDVQKSIRDGIVQCKSQLDELNHYSESEKMTVHDFAQDLREAINKTQSNILLEIQRQYETKERTFHNQLVHLSSSLPIIQQYVNLCQNFATNLNKFQFLEVAMLMIDRLKVVSKLSQPIRTISSSQIQTNHTSEFALSLEPLIGKLMKTSVAPPAEERIYEAVPRGNYSSIIPPHITVQASLKQHPAVKAKALEGDGPFANHCRSFSTQIKEITLMMKNVRDRLNELRKDVSLLYRATGATLLNRYQNITQDCIHIRDTLERNWVELDRLSSIFQSVWQEQICRIQVEQDIFHSQVNEIANLRSEFNQLITVAETVEPCISQIATPVNNDEVKQLRLNSLELSNLKDFKRLPKEKRVIRNASIENKPAAILKTISPTETTKSFQHGGSTYDRKCENQNHNEKTRVITETKSGSRGVLSQLIEKVRKSPVTDVLKERSKSEDRTKECGECRELLRQKSVNVMDGNVGRSRGRRVSNLYHSFGGYRNRIMKSSSTECQDRGRIEKSPELSCHYVQPKSDKFAEFILQQHARSADKTKDVNQKLQDIQTNKGDSAPCDKKESDYQSINEATTSALQQQQQYPKPAINRTYYSSDDDSDYVNPSYDRKKNIRTPRKRPGAPSPPPRRIRRRRYPHSDTEDAVFYTSRTRSGCSSMEVENNGKTLVVVIGTRKKGGKCVTSKQRSWETFPPKKKIAHKASPTFFYNPETFNSHFDVASIHEDKIKKSDSFEGHEEAVSSLVQEFQKIRMLEKQKQCSKNRCNSNNESPL